MKQRCFIQPLLYTTSQNKRPKYKNKLMRRIFTLNFIFLGTFKPNQNKTKQTNKITNRKNKQNKKSWKPTAEGKTELERGNVIRRRSWRSTKPTFYHRGYSQIARLLLIRLSVVVVCQRRLRHNKSYNSSDSGLTRSGSFSALKETLIWLGTRQRLWKNSMRTRSPHGPQILKDVLPHMLSILSIYHPFTTYVTSPSN